MPLINLTAISNSLRRTKQQYSAIVTQMEASTISVPLSTSQQELSSHCRPALKERKTQSDTLASKAESGMMEGFESHRGPAAPEEMREADASFGTGEEYISAASPLKNEKREALQEEEEGWAEDELVELMRRAVEERAACREELEMLREHSAALEDEKNQLINRLENVEAEKTSLSSLCDQLKSELSQLKEEKHEHSKLQRLRLNLGRLLVSFIPTLRRETLDYNSDVIDQILIQVLENIT